MESEQLSPHANNDNQFMNVAANKASNKIKDEQHCFDLNNDTKKTVLVQMASVADVNTNNNNTTATTNSNGSVISPKMGSRRIFTPQFKLQVLESYRNDNDCKGNQRATARKYNIHRRQIQKWLQCESNLRSSVANINQSTVKHQFHNINMQHQQSQQSAAAAGKHAPTMYGTLEQHHNGNGLNHHHHHHHQLALDAAKSAGIAVPPYPMMIGSLTSSSAAAAAAAAAATSSQTTEGVFAAANIAAVVAAAAAAGAAGAMAITSSSSSPCNSAPATSKTVSSPLRPTAIIGSSSQTTATMSPSLMQHHHHHHYGIPQYTHTPASIPLSVPILTHRIPHTHIHQQQQQQQHHHHHPYHYHNLTHAQTLTHQVVDKTQSSSSSSSAFLPSASLSAITALPTAAAAASIVSAAPHAPAANRFLPIANAIRGIEYIDERESLVQLSNKTAINSDLLPENNNTYLHNGSGGDQKRAYDRIDNGSSSEYSDSVSSYHQNSLEYPIALSLCPMDLSVGPRRDAKNAVLETNTNATKSNGQSLEVQRIESSNKASKAFDGNSSIVDLTYRKRKNLAISETNFTLFSHSDDHDDIPEKHAKFFSCSQEESSINLNKTDSISKEHLCSEDDPEAEIEVGGVEQKKTPSKPVKLFKPYLLDDETDPPKNASAAAAANDKKSHESAETRTWVSCMSNDSTSGYDLDSSRGAFQAPVRENASRSPNFQSGFKSSASPPSAFSPTTSVPTLSPTVLQCPKGSPASSGYESSSSTYSESSLSSQSENYGNFAYGRTYSLNLQMHAIYSDNLVLHPSNHVQKWLEQDRSLPPPAQDSSIALYA